MISANSSPISILRGAISIVWLLLFTAEVAQAQSYPHPWIIGHRGGTVDRPENTLLTYDHSLNNDVTGVEFDVWLSSDGFPVCHHDLDVVRTTDGIGPITDKTLVEILMLDAGSWFDVGQYAGTPVPRFEEGLQIVEQRGKLLLDIKAISYVPTIVTYIEDEEFPKDDVWVWNRFGTGAPFEALMPEAHIVTSMTPLADYESRIHGRTLAGEDGINDAYTALDKPYVDLAHSYGLLVMSHTVVSPRFQEQIDLGIDIVVASNPTVFAASFLPQIDPQCIDGIDNDGDGLTDFPADPSCWGNEDDAEYAACSDGIDNDGDGNTDFPNDPGCFASFYPLEDPECSDGVDNNQDGNIDFPDDVGCFALFDQGELPACANGIDDDGDGFIDYPDDPGCASVSMTTEKPECDDGIDDDGDGLVDFGFGAGFGSDPGCETASDSSESDAIRPACNDAVDNDADGFVDYPEDPECLGYNDNSENPECNDGIDNDFDGLSDLQDPDCVSPMDLSERVECANGLDDDGDGLIDTDDADCFGNPDPSESPECADGLDNDDDQLIDFPADPQCSSADDPLEQGFVATPLLGPLAIAGLIASLMVASCTWMRSRG